MRVARGTRPACGVNAVSAKPLILRLATPDRSPLPRRTYPSPDPGAGVGYSGAPPTETGPTGLLGSRDVFLRDVLAKWARAFGCVMEDVVSGVTAFCTESTRAISEES